MMKAGKWLYTLQSNIAMVGFSSVKEAVQGSGSSGGLDQDHLRLHTNHLWTVLEANTDTINTPDVFGRTPLFWAVLCDQVTHWKLDNLIPDFQTNQTCYALATKELIALNIDGETNRRIYPRHASQRFAVVKSSYR